MAYINLGIIENELLLVGFGDQQGTNSDVVKELVSKLKSLRLTGGRILKINGACTVASAYVIAHSVCHIYGVVAVYDPKIDAYVVVISHDPDYSIGDTMITSAWGVIGVYPDGSISLLNYFDDKKDANEFIESNASLNPEITHNISSI